MSGLNNGNKYMYSHNMRESLKEQEGVFFGKKSGKWIVNIKNNTKSKHMRPVITIAQYDNKEDADTHYSTVRSKSE